MTSGRDFDGRLHGRRYGGRQDRLPTEQFAYLQRWHLPCGSGRLGANAETADLYPAKFRTTLRNACENAVQSTTNRRDRGEAEVFHWDDGLKLTRADLAVDFRRRQPRAFVSHAHADHIARHEYALCTPATAALYQFRLGPRLTLPMPYRTPIEWGGLRLTTFPAGHCLGSAMLLAEDGETSLLYTGDFKLGDSATAERAELPRAEILVIESTYGTPLYRLPPRNLVIEQLCELVRRILGEGATPVVTAYALGKAQEVTRVLADAGFSVLQHRHAFAVSRIYESLGVRLGCRGPWDGMPAPGSVLVVPPGIPRSEFLPREVRIAVTGWAIDPRTRHRLHVDHAVPLSDHADYDELFEAVRRVGPRRVYCTHGPDSFVGRLIEAGFDARPLGKSLQKWLF